MKSQKVWTTSQADLQNLNGHFNHEQCRILFMLVAVHRWTTQWKLTNPVTQETFYIGFVDGLCNGFVGEMEIDGQKSSTIEQAMSGLMTTGVEYLEAQKRILLAIVHTVFSFERDLQIIHTSMDFGSTVVLDVKMSDVIIQIINELEDETAVLKKFVRLMSAQIRLTEIPFTVNRLQLSLSLMKYYRSLKNGSMVKDALSVENRVTEEWYSLNRLVMLGLVVIEGNEGKDEARQNSPIQTNTLAESSSVKSSSSKVDVEKVRPFRQFLEKIRSQPAYITFELTAPNQVNDQYIDQVFRNFAKEYHPDRHMGLSNAEKEVVAEVYTELNELYNLLKGESIREELKKRLDVERRGLQYVTAEDEKKSELLQAQGVFHFRKKKFAEALEQFNQAFKLNPYNWRTNAYIERCMAETGMKAKKEVALILAENKEARGADRVDILYQSGLYYLQEGMEKEAYEMFRKVVEIDEKHIDAKRHLHLKSKKNETVEEEEKSSFFSRLFGKK